MLESFLREYLLILIPYIVLEVSLKGFCIWKICKEGVGNLSKGAWLVIVLIVNLFGPILFLMLGRRRDLY